MAYRRAPITPQSSAKDKLVEEAVRRFRLAMRRKQEAEEQRPGRVIAFSRILGGGGRRVAEIVAERLQWQLYDREIVELLATKAGQRHHLQMFEALDERVQDQIQRIVAALLGQVDQFTYFRLLPKVILTLAQHDCIILGRGVHLLAPEALKVRVEASMPTRVENMMRFENLSKSAARRRVVASDKAREDFLRELMSYIPEKRQWYKERLVYDIVVNTDRFGVADAVEIVLRAAQQRFGLKVV